MVERKDLILGLSLFILGIISRIPFLEKMQSHWDGPQYSIGIVKYSLLDHTPAPPGYPIYIGLGKFANLITNDPHLAILTVSVFMTGTGAALFFYAGKHIFNKTVGIIASLIYLSSPVFYYFGTTANPYGGMATTTLLLSFVVYKIFVEKKNWAVLLGITFSFAVGYRPQDAIFLVPMLMLGIYSLKSGRIMAIVTLILFSLIWFIPLLLSAGGLTSYLETLNEYRTLGALTFPSLESMKSTSFSVVRGVFLTISIGLLFWLNMPALRDLLRNKKIAILLSFIILPSLLFNLIIRSDHAAHQVTFLTGLILVTAYLIYILFNKRKRLLLTAVILLISFNLFTFFRVRDVKGTRPYVSQSYHYSEIVKNNIRLKKTVDYILNNHTPSNTIVIVDPEIFRQYTYYLKEYKVFSFGSLDVDVLPHRDIVHQGYNWEYKMAISEDHVFEVKDSIEDILFVLNNKPVNFLIDNAYKSTNLPGNSILFVLKVDEGDKFQFSKATIKQIRE